MKKKNTLALVLAMLLVVSAASIADTVAPDALPSDIKWSEDMQTVYSAWAAVREAYGMTRYDLSLFMPEEPYSSDAVEFVPIAMIYEDMLGTYTVKRDKEGAFVATWSHDDAADKEALETADLSSPIWGSVQAKLLIDMESKHSLAYVPIVEAMDEKGITDLAKEAAADKIYTDAGYTPGGLAVEPGPGDVSPEGARDIAIASIVGMHSIAPDDFRPIHEGIGLYEDTLDGTRRYSLTFVLENPKPPVLYEYDYGYQVHMDAKTGEVLTVSITGSNPSPSLPEGSLSNHWQAVQNFLAYDGVNKLSHAERPEVARRIKESGYADRYNLPEYQVPGEDALPEEDALAAAALALGEAYGMQQEALYLFDIKPSYVKQAGKPVWDIDITVNEEKARPLPYGASSAIGYYDVVLDGITGELLDVTWSFDHAAGSRSLSHVEIKSAQDIAGSGWANLEIIDASILPMAAEFAEKMAVLWDRYPMSVEDQVAEAKLYQEAGDIDGYYKDIALPGEDHITLDDAMAIATVALEAFYDIPPETTKQTSYWETFYDDGITPRWEIYQYRIVEGMHEFSDIVIHAETGEVLDIHVGFRGNG